jgi:hypothetical protein
MPSQLVLRSIEQEFDVLAVGKLLGCKQGPPVPAVLAHVHVRPLMPAGYLLGLYRSNHSAWDMRQAFGSWPGSTPKGAVHGQNAFKPDQPDR